jgi:cyclopropane fatty-acyl-phospholipid synthase-like methyltransferase
MAPGALIAEAAASVDATPALAPVLGELFAEMDALGSSPRQTVHLLRTAGIGAGDRVLDLGCGRGGVTVAAAKQLGCRCVGVDAVPAFVQAARSLAIKRSIQVRCEFRVGDVRRVRSGRTFNAGLMLGLFDAVRATALLRTFVRPGGVMIVDDAVAVGPQRKRRGWMTLAEANAAITRRGDQMIGEVVWSAREVRAHEATLYARLANNATRLARARPELSQELEAFLRRQRAAGRELAGSLRPVVWLMRVSGR